MENLIFLHRNRRLSISQPNIKARVRRKTIKLGILKSAKKLFIKRGFKKTTMTEIAIISEISKKLLYKHFTKDTLLLFLYIDFLDELYNKLNLNLSCGRNNDCQNILHFLFRIMQSELDFFEFTFFLFSSLKHYKSIEYERGQEDSLIKIINGRVGDIASILGLESFIGTLKGILNLIVTSFDLSKLDIFLFGRKPANEEKGVL